jgi:plastocyanin
MIGFVRPALQRRVTRLDASRRVVLKAGSLVAVCVLLAARTRQSVAQEKVAIVNIDNFTFTPVDVIIQPGTTVKWTNRDDIPHVVADKSLAWRSKALDTDDSFEHTFNSAGKFEYFCTLHPHMTGTVTVTQ